MSRSFDRLGPPRIVFGDGAEARVPALLSDLDANRVLGVATARHRAGADRLAGALGDRSVGVWAQAAPQVPRTTVDSLVAAVKEAGADWLLVHGGGSAIGAAKAAAMATGAHIAAVPTTYSGSEMTDIWGISDGDRKTTGRATSARPSLVVYDPTLLAHLRAGVRDASLLNALAHSVDALFDADASTHVHDRAEESVTVIVRALRGFAREATDITSVPDALYGAHLAGAVLADAKMALQHKLAHVLGGCFGTPHAGTHAALLPHTLAFNLLSSPNALKRLRRATRSRDPAATLFDLATELRVPLTLTTFGFGRGDIDEAVAQALQRRYTNPRDITAANLAGLLSDAVHGRRPSIQSRRLPLSGVMGPHSGLDATCTGPSLRTARAVALALHGRGSAADTFAHRLAADVPRGVTVVAPQADSGTWYPKGFRQVDANATHLASALSALDSTFAAIMEHVPPKKIVLIGFSQGACLALTWLAHRAGRSVPASVVAWTGAAIPGHIPAHIGAVRVYLGTASADPWVPITEARDSAARLETAGADVDFYVAPSSIHAIRPNDRAAFRRALEFAMTGDDLTYQTGYGNALSTEALPGALPQRQNGPRSVPYGLYAEQLNGTGFTVQRAQNHRVWMYRLRPQIAEEEWTPLDGKRFTGRFDQGTVSPNLLRFAPQPYPEGEVDWLAGLQTFAGAGDPTTKAGFAVHIYTATAHMERAFTNLDGDFLVVPQEGALRIQTELGWLHAAPGEIVVLPRGIRFRVLIPDGRARGFVGELFNGHYQLPERGPVGANGLADERHFKAPVAAFEQIDGPYPVVSKGGGDLWASVLPGSPFDVVAWHGTYAPFKYDLMDFNAYWGANWDHPDPSILTVLTSPHDVHGRNAVDFAVFKGRWDTIEHSFRPPFLHRNSAVEFNAVIKTPATTGPYVAGATTYTPYLAPHGTSKQGHERGITEREGADDPVRLSDDELWIQFETTYPLRVMPWFADAPHRDRSYLDQFQGFVPAKPE